MQEISEKTLHDAYKPFDIVTDVNGNVGMIQEVVIHKLETDLYQALYAVKWLVGSQEKVAWYNHVELTKHCNIMVEIAKQMCNPFNTNSTNVVNSLFKAGME